jgi:hypothetical protein
MKNKPLRQTEKSDLHHRDTVGTTTQGLVAVSQLLRFKDHRDEI